MDYEIRLAKKDDCKKLSKLKRDIWETTYRGIYPDEKIDNFNFEENEKKFLNIIENKNVELYVLVVEGKIVGYMSCGEPIRKFQNFKHEIGLLYIQQDFQGKGYGKILFEKGKESIKENGACEFFISCNKYNVNAQKFYEKMGGKIIHVDPDTGDKSCDQVKFLYNI